ncbi:DNA repair protein RecN [Candidatus Hepatincolaceae symbiont of Richtersius coronifer]
MLKELHIKNVILIKDLKVKFKEGLSVFTGETGAGKSILLDSLSLILGERFNTSFIRKNQEFAGIVAIFDITNHPVQGFLKENFIEFSDELIIRRIISLDGKSKNFVNDIPASINFLKTIGSTLLDIHGQFDNQKLLNPAVHRDILDSFLPNKSLVDFVYSLYGEYKNLQKEYEQQQHSIANLFKEKEYIEYSIDEMENLKLVSGEAKTLLEQKIMLNSANRIKNQLDVVEDTLISKNIGSILNKALKQLDGVKSLVKDNSEVDVIISLLESSYTNFAEGLNTFLALRNSLDFSESTLQEVEERLMSLKTVARKHNVNVENLPQTLQDFKIKLEDLNKARFSLEDIEKNLQIKQKEFTEQANILSQARKETALLLDRKINAELTFLKLQDGEFHALIEDAPEGPYGKNKVIFKVRTNKGSDFGDINKIASGGEMARFMLALKIILAEVDTINTIILDEIDIGVGGEVAEAIGNRLLYLAQRIQTIVVTHSHQVASKGTYHYKVIKNNDNNEVTTRLVLLDNNERIEELARMLSGAQITEEARATAASFLNKL